MRILERGERGRLRLQLESQEDLYFVSLLIDEGDLVTAWTSRQLRVERATGSERGERVRVKLTVRVKKVEFQRFTDSVRVLGVVTEAPEWLSALGSHHTIGLRVGDEVEIVKQAFTRYHERILRLASATAELAGVVSVDVGEVAAAVLRPQGLEVVSVVSIERPGKEGSLKASLGAQLSKVLPQVLSALRARGCRRIIVAAPELVLEVAKELVPDAQYVRVAEGGLAGLYELLRSHALRGVLAELHMSEVRQALEELLSRLHRGSGKVALGVEEVEAALQARAVEALLVLDEALLGGERGRIASILERASETLRTIAIVPPSLEGAELLRRCGGVAALLYFDVGTAEGKV